jgi:hypothetical protein
MLIAYHITELQRYIRLFQSERLRCAIGVDFKVLSREIRKGAESGAHFTQVYGFAVKGTTT